MYEFSSAICAAAVVTWLVVLRASATACAVGPFVLLPVVALMFIGLRVLYAEAAPVQPALQSYWLVVHVTTISISSAAARLGVASALYLLRRAGRLDRLPGRTRWTAGLPRHDRRVPAVHLRRHHRRRVGRGGVGPVLGWDPKETVAFVSWVVYAAYLHARATAGWRTERAAWINVVGFATVLFNLFFINMVVAGLHSYAGLG
jgi:ABC-type transport system involved in cytochrome c biogenesis permease subunit